VSGDPDFQPRIEKRGDEIHIKTILLGTSSSNRNFDGIVIGYLNCFYHEKISFILKGCGWLNELGSWIT
jgi:hypothetical protein